MNINDWNTIFLIFVLLLIAGYVYLLQERITKLEDRQDIQQKINDELHKTFIRWELRTRLTSSGKTARFGKGHSQAGGV